MRSHFQWIAYMNKQKKMALLLLGALLTTLCACRARLGVSLTSTFEPDVISTWTPGMIPAKPTTQPLQFTPMKMMSEECIKSFDDFVVPVVNPYKLKTPIIAPLPPWQIEATIPTRLRNYEIEFIWVNISAIRMDGEYSEIWLRGATIKSERSTDVFLTYKPKAQSWNLVSTQIMDTDLTVFRLFVSHNGSVWGQTDTRYIDFELKDVPVLSRYNETTGRFEFPLGLMEIPGSRPKDLGPKSVMPLDMPFILLDKQDIFWIFTLDGGIYQYNPITGRSPKKVAALSESYVSKASLSPDGSIFLLKNNQAHPGYISDGDLLQFYPKTGEIVPLKAPEEQWPMVWGFNITVDHIGRLWLDSEGYRQPDGSWYLIHPDIEGYSRHLGHPEWSMPANYIESSNGILWFTRSLDNSYVDGAAWYDPKTGKGCMFTNLPVWVMEDGHQTLWLAADGKLYRYKLEVLPK